MVVKMMIKGVLAWFCYKFSILAFILCFCGADACSFDDCRRGRISDLCRAIQESVNPLTTRRMILSSFIFSLCYHPSRYLSGLHNSSFDMVY